MVKICIIFVNVYIFAAVKRALFILSILLPLLLNCSSVSGREIINACEYVLNQSADSNDSRDFSDFDVPCLSYARTVGFSQEDNTNSSTVRSFKTGRRIQLQAKSNCRIVKDGRVIDSSNFYTYRTHLQQFQSGTHSTQRYIHIICQLLI